MSQQTLTADYPLTSEQIETYRRDGFIKLDHVITGEELEDFRNAVADAVAAEDACDAMGRKKEKSDGPKGAYEKIFIQKVNLWQRHEGLKPFTLSPKLANIAAKLCGKSVRIWHDQALFKEARTGANTPWHQDAPYWPHQDRSEQLSIWIALKDATTQNGCMSFIPGTHKIGVKEAVNLGPDAQNVYDVAPEAKGIKAVTHELKAGSATFHNGLTFHYAGPNRSEETREAYVVIYMPSDTVFDGSTHCVTHDKGYEKDRILEGEDFPVLSTI